jgi:hypothetical protein
MFLGTASWLSFMQVKLPIGLGGVTSYQILMNSEWHEIYTAVRAGVLRSLSERERTQTNS